MSQLVKVVLLMLVCTATGVLTRVQALKWRRINNADALCNDFTRAGYYIRTNDSSSDWVVFLESGGVCYSADTCNRRYSMFMRSDFGQLTLKAAQCMDSEDCSLTQFTS